MEFTKTYKNGLKVILNNIDGAMSVSCGIMVKTGSANETKENNGISHFIEHTVFKGTKKRTAFEISDKIDSIGAQINAFTSKELTCFYTKSTYDHLEDSLEVLSDIFFNSTFDDNELEKEKGVIIEEINMTEDTPDEVCLDLLSKAYYGTSGYGQTILGPIKNVKKFDKNYISDYMTKYYNADNICISISGKVDIDKTEKLIETYFVNNFSDRKSKVQVKQKEYKYEILNKFKKTEQSHISICLNGYGMKSSETIPLSIADAVFGGGMSSKLFQRIREQLGLCYTIFSYPSQYKDNGIEEIYAGVTNEKREEAFNAIIEETNKFRNDGITKKEFLRGKEQIKSSFVFGQESAGSQMLLLGKYYLFLNEKFDFEKKIKQIESVTLDDVNKTIKNIFNFDKYALASVGPNKNFLKINN